MVNNFALGLSCLWILATASTYLGVALVRRWAEQRLLDVPNERSSHSQPTPRGGGLAIVVCTLTGLWLVFFLLGWGLSLLPMLAYTVGTLLIASVSWLDDLWSLSNRVRFLAQAGGALLALFGLGSWRQLALPLLGLFDLGWLGVLITFVWIVGLTNAYNFMDGIDGLAGGQAIVAGVAWLGLGLLSGDHLICLLGALVTGGSLGFLGHNWPPARIFMGDVGSAFLGYTFATLAVMGNQVDARLALIGVLVVWPFVFDTTFTLLRRLRRKENIFTAHRSHLYQRLVIAGYTHRFVTMIYMGLALTGVLIAFAWLRRFLESYWLVLGVPGVLSLGLWQLVVHAEARLLQPDGRCTTGVCDPEPYDQSV